MSKTLDLATLVRAKAGLDEASSPTMIYLVVPPALEEAAREEFKDLEIEIVVIETVGK